MSGKAQKLIDAARTDRDAILAAVSRLSPSVRELLISRPEAVESCVKAVEALPVSSDGHCGLDAPSRELLDDAIHKLTGERP